MAIYFSRCRTLFSLHKTMTMTRPSVPNWTCPNLTYINIRTLSIFNIYFLFKIIGLKDSPICLCHNLDV